LLVLPAGQRWALAAGLAAAVTMAQPTSANPAATALALALGSVFAASRGRPALAGTLAGVTAFWRPDFGGVAALAVLAVLIVRARDPARTVPSVPSSLRRVAVGFGASVVALYLPFVVAAGVPAVWDGLIAASARDTGAWRLPFPLAYDGGLDTSSARTLAEDAKDVLNYYVPLTAVIALGLAAVLAGAAALRARRPDPYRARQPADPGVSGALAGLLVLGGGMTLYLLGRADDLHAQPLAAVACGALPLAAAAVAGPGPAGAPIRRVAAALVAVLLVAGVANRVSALVLAPDLERVHVPGVPGIKVPPQEARAIPRLVRHVQRLTEPGEPIYVAPRRSDLVALSDPLIHTLVRRPNVLRRDVFLQAPEREQRAIVAALERARPPVVVRWLDPASTRPEPNARGRSSGSRVLDRHLARTYRREARYGAYEILRRRG
jgi:hypothetical protein